MTSPVLYALISYPFIALCESLVSHRFVGVTHFTRPQTRARAHSNLACVRTQIRHAHNGWNDYEYWVIRTSARSFTHSKPLTHSLATHCSLRSRAPLRSLVRSHRSLTRSQARGAVLILTSQLQSSGGLLVQEASVALLCCPSSAWALALKMAATTTETTTTTTTSIMPQQ